MRDQVLLDTFRHDAQWIAQLIQEIGRDEARKYISTWIDGYATTAVGIISLRTAFGW